jgi:lipocalin
MGTRDARRDESTEFWAAQFAGRWYRGPAHLENDFRRFTAAYRVPASEREAVRERAFSLMGDSARRAA